MTSTLRDSLKQASASAHSALEATVMMRAFASGQPNVEDCGDCLMGQWQLHAPLEAALRVWVPADLAALRLQQAPWLLADLHALGALPDDRLAEVPRINFWAQALGVLYVIEGGTPGLQVAGKRLSDDHPALGAAGRFMHGHGAVDGQTLPDLFAPHCQIDDVAALRLALATGKALLSLRLRGRAKAGPGAFTVVLNGEPMKDRDLRITGWHGTLTDTTLEVAMQATLRDKEVAELPSQAKSSFLSSCRRSAMNCAPR